MPHKFSHEHFQIPSYMGRALSRKYGDEILDYMSKVEDDFCNPWFCPEELFGRVVPLATRRLGLWHQDTMGEETRGAIIFFP